MTRHGEGGFGGGGGGGGDRFDEEEEEGRSGGGSFGPPTHSHLHPPPPSRQPHRATEVMVRFNRKTELLNDSVAIFFVLLVTLFIGTIWLYGGPYGSTELHLGVHDSRLVSASPYFVKSIKFKNRYEVEGPVFHEFDEEPALNRESSWQDLQSTTFCNGHQEFFYWMNKGSTVTVTYKLDVIEKLEPVFLGIIRNRPHDLEHYYNRPRLGSSVELHDAGVFTYRATADAEYAMSLVTHNPTDVTIRMDSHFRTRDYDTDRAIQHKKLKTKCKMTLPVFSNRYGLLEGLGSDEMGVDTWDIELSYEIRWLGVILIYGLLTLAYVGTTASIMASINELGPSLAESAQALLVPRPQETQARTAVSRSAPVLPASMMRSYGGLSTQTR